MVGYIAKPSLGTPDYLDTALDLLYLLKPQSMEVGDASNSMLDANKLPCFWPQEIVLLHVQNTNAKY